MPQGRKPSGDRTAHRRRASGALSRPPPRRRHHPLPSARRPPLAPAALARSGRRLRRLAGRLRPLARRTPRRHARRRHRRSPASHCRPRSRRHHRRPTATRLRARLTPPPIVAPHNRPTHPPRPGPHPPRLAQVGAQLLPTRAAPSLVWALCVARGSPLCTTWTTRSCHRKRGSILAAKRGSRLNAN